MGIMKNLTIGFAIALVAALFIFTGKSFATATTDTGDETAITGQAIASDQYQEVTLKMINYKYITEPAELIKNVPVRMTVDLDSVSGCMRDVVISAFDVREYVQKGDNIIEFTPDKTGEIQVVCSMNMGRGSFTVVDNNGQINEEEQAKVSAIQDTTVADSSGTCGGSCGGAGTCGGSGSCGGSCGA